MTPRPSPPNRRRLEAGFSLTETIVAGFILIVLATSIVEAGLRSRRQFDYDEVRRRAVSIGQERLETVRAQFRFDDIVKARIDTTITSDGTLFTIRSRVTKGYNPVTADSLEGLVKFVTDTVSWTAVTPAGGTVKSTVLMSTYFYGGL
jgi:Tfp pilus assembly protein PilV